MNSYPPELLTQLAPVMFVAGLDADPSPQPPPSGKVNDFVLLASRLREALQAQRRVAIWQPEKTKTFQIFLVEKDIRFPPRKLVPPEDPTYSAAHSPLSPLTPTSPLHPDGLIAPIWIRKHTSLVPSVFVLFLRIYEHPPSNSATSPLDLPDLNREREKEVEERRRDTELAAEVAQRKKGTNERGIKLTVVLMATRKLLDDSSLDARLTFIRRQSGLDSRAALFVLSPQALYEPALEYYTGHSKRVRRKRNRHSQANYPNPLPGASNIPRPLRSEGWTVRYEYKMACFAEFRGEDEVALKSVEKVSDRVSLTHLMLARHYQDAHSMLVVMFGSTAILPPRTKRWAEAKVLADCINLKIIKLYLYNNEHALALSHQNTHVRIFSDFSRGWGIGEETFEYWSWIAKQYRVFAELLEQGTRSTLVIPVHLPVANIPSNQQNGGRGSSASALEVETIRSLGINPSHALQHSGFYYFMAAKCTEARRERYLAALEIENSRNIPTPSPGFANEKKVDHLALILELYTKAYELFKKHTLPNPQNPTQSRLTLWIAYRIAQTYYESAKYDMAIRFFERIATIYRRESWDSLLEPLLTTWYACARELGDIQLSIKLLIEMLGHVSTNSEDPNSTEEDLLAILRSTVQASDEALVVDLSESRQIVDHSVAFWAAEANVDEPAAFQLSLSAREGVSVSSLPISSLSIQLSHRKSPVIVRHQESKDSSPLPFQLINMGHISSSSEDQEEITAVLRWDVGGCIVLSGMVSSEIPTSITATLLNEEYPITIDITNNDTRPLDVVVNVLIPPTEIDGAGDERSSNFIKGVSFGVLAPGATAVKTLYLVSAGAPGDRVVDMSIQSRATPSIAVESAESETGDITETTRVLVVPTVDPFKVVQTISYRRSLDPWPGLANLGTFDGDKWNPIRTCEALINTRIECVGPSPVQVEAITFEKRENERTRFIGSSVDDTDTSASEYHPGDELSQACRFALSASEDDDSHVPIPSPGTYHITWRRIHKDGTLSSQSSTTASLPPLQPPIEGLIALLSIPSPATLHRPIPLTLTIRNHHATRSANVVVQLELEPSDGFIVAGLRSGRLPILMPGDEETFTWKLIPIECGHVKIPQIKVIDKRPIFTGGTEPTADMVTKGEIVKIVDVRLAPSLKVTDGQPELSLEGGWSEINPKGLVPAVEYKGRAIYESLVICEFFEDLYPTQKPLLPSDPTSRAIARIWIDYISKSIVPASHRLMQAQDAAKQSEFLEEYKEALRKYAKEAKGPYFLGEEFSLVDVAIAPWIVRDYVLQEHRGYNRGDVSDAWVKYASLVESRKSVIETQSVSIPLMVLMHDSLKSRCRRENISTKFTVDICEMKRKAKLLKQYAREERFLELRPQHLAVHLKLVPSSQGPDDRNVEAYVGWTGMASASSLTQFSAAHTAEKTLETVEIDPQYAQGLGLNQGDLVEIGLLHDLPYAQSVATEPVTSDDWEIIEIHASHVESTLLSQVRVAKAGQEIDVWVMGRTRVRLKVVSLSPSLKDSALLLTTDTEVSIAPKLHGSNRRTDAKPRQDKDTPKTNGDVATKDTKQILTTHVLRVLPQGTFPSALPEYAGTELVGYISAATFEKLFSLDTVQRGDLQCFNATFKRLVPPADPSSSSSSAAPPPAAPTTRVIKPNASGSNDTLEDDVQREDIIFVGSLKGLVDGHIVFPAVPKGVEDWDLLALSLPDNTNHPNETVKVTPASTFTSHPLAVPTTVLAGVDQILENATNFCVKQFVSQSRADSLNGVCALLLTGRSGTGKTAVAQHVAKTIQEDSRIYSYVFSVDVSRYANLPIATIKSLLRYWFEKAMWHRPSILILDNIDKLVGTELEHADSFRTRHITELFLAQYSSSSRTAIRNTRGMLLLATASSSASLHPLINGAHIFQEEIKIKPPNNEARRDIIESIVQGRLSSAQDIRIDPDASLNYTTLATWTEGYSVTDLQDLVGRAIHQVAIRAADKVSPALLSPDDFKAAQDNFTPLSLRDVKLQKSDIAWSDIGGLHETRRMLRETLEWPTKYGPIFAQSPLRLRSGLLLYGFPGCGKTLLASAVAKECGLNFISVKGPEILNKYIGASEKSVRDLFDRASAAKPCVLFFDEFDSIAPKRGHDSTGVTDRVVNQMLTQMDGAEGLDGVYVLAATSRPDLIDSALLRPGRLDKLLFCGMPDLKERKEILEAVGRKVSVSPSVQWEEIAATTEGFSGADLQALVYNAHLEVVHTSLVQTSNDTVSSPGSSGDDRIEFKAFGGPSNGKTYSRAEQSSLEKRLRQIRQGSQAKPGATPSIKQERKRHEIASEHLQTVLKTMRPSVSAEEHLRLDRIYRAFVSDRSTEFSVPPEAGGIGNRASLA
ncbi:hypothetical protein H0H92_007700 [Tricholoma furcatifolium]|nr:hypothetical protein H0H92_007700 [Tricholoma furcatifolium]